MLKINDPKVLRAWCFYDWANSVHNLVITTVVFPMYFLATAVTMLPNGAKSEMINIFGYQLPNYSAYSYAISAGTFILILINPFLSSLADSSGRQKLFLKIFCYLGSASCMYLFFFTRGNHTAALVAFSLSIVGWGGSIIFYNSFLPKITDESNYDRLSARGFMYGYVGSVILLIFNLLMILKPELFGLSKADSASGLTSRISFLLVGIWWILFAQIPFYYLPADENLPLKDGLFKSTFTELKHTLSEIYRKPLITKFLAAFFFYDMGVQTVIYIAAIFAKDELKIPQEGLITTLLLIQLVAIPGSYLASYLSSKFGNATGLLVFVALWSLAPIGAYFTYTPTPFYYIAAMVGLVMGGIQSLSRSTFAKLLPEGISDTASYFGVYDIVEKIAIFLGTLIFGTLSQNIGMRSSVLFILVLFLAGFALLLLLPSKKTYH
jgi:MFS transporter, UMF1 family